MTDHVLAALVGLVVCGLAGALTPYLIRILPEPPPRTADTESDAEPDTGSAEEEQPGPEPEEPPKELYADLGRRPRLVPVAAVIAAVAGAGLGLTLGWDWSLCLLWPLVSVGTLLGIVDWHTRLLPSIVVLPATGFALAYGVVRWAVTGDPDALVRGLVAMLVVRTVFWILWFIRQAGMGFGDVRLSALLGLVLGYGGTGMVLVGIYGAFLLFAVPGVVVALVKWDRSVLKRAVPFGPALLVGAWIALVATGSLTSLASG